MSRFQNVSFAQNYQQLEIDEGFQNDLDSRKLDIGNPGFFTDKGIPWVFPVVQIVEKVLASDLLLDKEEIPNLGYRLFGKLVVQMILGADSLAIVEGRAFGIQTYGGTGGWRVGAEFLCQLGYKTVYFSDPHWIDLNLIFTFAGFKDIRKYRYWNKNDRAIDMRGFLDDLYEAPEHSVIILYTCAHFPTGLEFTKDQWKKIAEVMQERRLFPFFNSSFLGFSSGDFDNDSWPVRYFVSMGFELFSNESFSVGYGLYCERIGNLTVVLNNNKDVPIAKAKMDLVVTGMYSSPSSHGARIVTFILNNARLHNEWRVNIREVHHRMSKMRNLLREEIEARNTPGDWSHITEQKGLYFYTGFTEEQAIFMANKYHLYFSHLGPMNICRVTTQNAPLIATAIWDAIVNVKD